MQKNLSRRNALKHIAGTSAIATTAIAATLNGQTASAASSNKQSDDEQSYKVKGSLKFSIPSGWRNRLKLSIPDFCKVMNRIGITGVDLARVSEWEEYIDNGLEVAMGSGVRNSSLAKSFSNPSLHKGLIEGYTEAIPVAAKLGVKQIICLSGNRNGLDDATGLKNCADCLKKLVPLAEDHGVILSMELLNSKVNHKDYLCDKTAWGVALCEELDSPNFRLLYDIYHMQIMEGDLIRTIRTYHKYFSHIHTAGNPGRHELGDTQEIYYPAVMRALVEVGYTGFVAHEFSPSRGNDPLTVLKEAMRICDV